jgi:hypothetical protein
MFGHNVRNYSYSIPSLSRANTLQLQALFYNPMMMMMMMMMTPQTREHFEKLTMAWQVWICILSTLKYFTLQAGTQADILKHLYTIKSMTALHMLYTYSLLQP